MAFIRRETVRKRQRHNQWWGGGGEVSPRKYVLQSTCQYDVTTRVSDFQNWEQSVHRRDRKKFRFHHGNTVSISWIWRF